MTVMPERSGVAARLREEGGPPSVSFELYPPRTAAGMTALKTTVERLADARPDFVSVTYGASGSTRETSRDVVRWVRATTDARVVAHLTCVGAPWDEVRRVAEGFLEDGVRDLLALRGDPPRGVPEWRPHPEGLRSGAELVARLRELADDLGEPVSLGVAATPSARWAAPPQLPEPYDDDIQALLAKQAAGADYAITQVFFEPTRYAAYVAAARAAGVTIPVVPGVVPLADPARLRRLQEISGGSVPPSVLVRLDTSPLAERADVGLRLGVGLVHRVLEAGAPGIHLYTFNQHEAVLRLLDGIRLRRPPRHVRVEPADPLG